MIRPRSSFLAVAVHPVVVTAVHRTMYSQATWFTLETLFVAVQFALVGPAFGIAHGRDLGSIDPSAMESVADHGIR